MMHRHGNADTMTYIQTWTQGREIRVNIKIRNIFSMYDEHVTPTRQQIEMLVHHNNNIEHYEQWK